MEKLPVAVGYTSPGEVKTLFCDSLFACLQRWEFDSRVSVTSGPRIADARNRIIEGFLTTDAEYLWMVDTDMAFPPETPMRLLECDKDIVGALCFDWETITGESRPVLSHFKNGQLVRYNEYPENRLVAVDATGAACLMIHRPVIEKLNDVYNGRIFAETYDGDVEYGEDVTFCLRAKEAGAQPFVHTGIRCGHVKNIVI